MRKLALFFFCSIVSCLCASARADNLMRIVVFGDSLTSGYQLQPNDAFPAKLQKKLEEVGYKNIEVLNMSVSGETTTGGLDRMNSLLAVRPDVVVMELGSNDVMRGINPNLIHRNLVSMVMQLLANKTYVVLVGIKAPPSLGYTYVQQIDTLYSTIAERYNVPLYPSALEGVSEKPEYNLADGYHPNALGVDVMVEGIYRLVDTGLRWKWQVLQYQEQYIQDMQMAPRAPAP